MHPVEAYLKELRDIHATGAAALRLMQPALDQHYRQSKS
jgi:hypothetical protein